MGWSLIITSYQNHPLFSLLPCSVIVPSFVLSDQSFIFFWNFVICLPIACVIIFFSTAESNEKLLSILSSHLELPISVKEFVPSVTMLQKALKITSKILCGIRSSEAHNVLEVETDSKQTKTDVSTKRGRKPILGRPMSNSERSKKRREVIEMILSWM